MVSLGSMSFWHSLPKPLMVLAPMANVTDASFRRMIAKYSRHVRKDGTMGGPDVMWTEFVSADGLMRATEAGKGMLMADLLYGEEERPIVAQLFSSHPEYMEGAARLCAELGFDGIDINMGCPDKTIERQGCGSAMIKNPLAAREVIRAAKRGAPGLAISVKTRIGYNTNEIETWLPALLEEFPDVITVHARTRKEMSKVPARWEHVARAVEIRNEVQKAIPENERTLILGNGDVTSLSDAEIKVATTGADGVMFGRAIFGNPWFFHPDINYAQISIREKLEALLEHTRLFEEILPHKNFALMKKHYKAYVHEFNGAKELRAALMETHNSTEVAQVVNRFFDTVASND